MKNNIKEDNNFLIYEDNSNVKVEVLLQDENIWLTQSQIGNLFNKAKSTINEHIKNIFEEGELIENSVVRNFRTTANDGKNYNVNYYNLDMIIAIGFRVKSNRGTQFRIWANKILKEYLVKGYNLNVERFKNNGYDPYFDELLEKIRDIRSSEKVFWRKVLDIYATSIDYNPKEKITIDFFKTVQNKMHYAVSKKTAAEIVYNRVDCNKNNIGLTNFKGDTPTRSETEIAKNYLSLEELEILNRLVSAYLDLAEINALKRKVMTMEDWIKELDSFLTMTHNDILKSKGSISHEQALIKAHEEYDKYMKNHLTKAEKDYLEIMNIDMKELN
ncbi:MAG: virulence RhuM family protein [Bacilli bacterium]|nr:virulence RhuM family protein [Bacilli bacterium]